MLRLYHIVIYQSRTRERDTSVVGHHYNQNIILSLYIKLSVRPSVLSQMFFASHDCTTAADHFSQKLGRDLSNNIHWTLYINVKYFRETGTASMP